MLKDYFINVTSFKSLRGGELGTSSSDTSAIIAIKLYSFQN